MLEIYSKVREQVEDLGEVSIQDREVSIDICFKKGKYLVTACFIKDYKQNYLEYSSFIEDDWDDGAECHDGVECNLDNMIDKLNGIR